MKGGGSGRRSYTKKYTAQLGEQGGVYGGGAVTDPCNIIFIITLQKTTPAVAALKKGDRLFIKIDKREIQAVNSAGNICGSIVSEYNSKILKCIEDGNSYVAIVNSNSATTGCKVTVQRS